MDPALTINDQPNHGPADPLRYNRPDEDLFAVQASEPDRLPPRDCHSLTCVACGNPTLMADFAPHTATCRACAAAERRLNEAVAPNWSGEP